MNNTQWKLVIDTDYETFCVLVRDIDYNHRVLTSELLDGCDVMAYDVPEYIARELNAFIPKYATLIDLPQNEYATYDTTAYQNGSDLTTVMLEPVDDGYGGIPVHVHVQCNADRQMYIGSLKYPTVPQKLDNAYETCNKGTYGCAVINHTNNDDDTCETY